MDIHRVSSHGRGAPPGQEAPCNSAEGNKTNVDDLMAGNDEETTTATEKTGAYKVAALWGLILACIYNSSAYPLHAR